MPNMDRRISPHATRLRRDSTDAERALWEALRGRTLEGHKFKRQWTLGGYVVDFCCWEAKLIIEADGGQYDEEKDAARTSWLESQGYRVIRFWNNDVLANLEGVQEKIREALTHPHPSPLPRAGEGA